MGREADNLNKTHHRSINSMEQAINAIKALSWTSERNSTNRFSVTSHSSYTSQTKVETESNLFHVSRHKPKEKV